MKFVFKKGLLFISDESFQSPIVYLESNSNLIHC